ncbi:MAG TPA: DUF2630 family protein [Candidatus Limnocylindrales bacterium]|nr:DUF2630 family protein [Candidatus Limnocylindrales bacterium]
MTDDNDIFGRINALSDEEAHLWEHAGDGHGLSAEEQERLEAIKVELDRTYDLLHQRQARRAAGLDPKDAEQRTADVVEGYQQ